MKAVTRWLDRFCYRHPNLGIPNLMKYIALGNVIVFVGDMVTMGGFSWMTRFYPELILQGQVWRLVTFIFSPVSSGGSNIFTKTLLFALTTFFYYWIGTSLERQWGTARFNVFYGLGVLLNILVGLIAFAFPPDMLYGNYYETANMYYVNMSMFFSFATLFPDMQVLLYGIIPLKVKWLAWVDAALFAFDIGFSFTAHNWLGVALPIIAILNYLIFFWGDLTGMLHRGQARVSHRMDRQTINFHKAQKEVQQRKGYLHKCAVCGITDADDPNMEFRYCSKCNGYYCYCMNHINNHTHVQ
ncbi:MAG: hypothetical protein ACOX7N_04255 [Lawsonibacter sp.]|jgi:hypothetical protein